MPDVLPAVITIDVGLKNANVSRTARFIVMLVAFGLLSYTGSDALPDLPTVSVSRPKEIIAGTAPPIVMIALFEVIVLLVSLAVIVALPFATPVTTPVAAFTVAFVGLDEMKWNALPPEMKNPFASLPRASNAVEPLTAIVAVVGDRSIAASTCCTLRRAVPLNPCAAAETVVNPFAAADTRTVVVPVESIAATEPFDEANVNVMPESKVLLESYANALYERERPSAVIVKVSLAICEKPAESRAT